MLDSSELVQHHQTMAHIQEACYVCRMKEKGARKKYST